MNDADEPTTAAGLPPKGRPTPTRKEAEEARRKAMKKPVTRKEQAARNKKARSGERAKMMAALDGTGDQAYLPARDKGPAKALTRDFVDRRFTMAEYMLPALVIVLVLTLIPVAELRVAAVVVMYAVIMLVVVDTIFVVFGLRRALSKHFTKTQARGCVSYGIMRTTQLRATRRPKPALKRGAPLREHY